MTQVDFDVVWRYFSWSNQTLAMIVLWAVAVYITHNAEKKVYSLIAALPAAFMTAVSVTYILMAEEGAGLSQTIGYPVGIVSALVFFGWFLYWQAKSEK